MQREIAERDRSASTAASARSDWTPIRYVNKTVGHTALAGLYRMARVGLVTPLRDGMNLVAKEFVAAQEPDDPGVLILSTVRRRGATSSTGLCSSTPTISKPSRSR